VELHQVLALRAGIAVLLWIEEEVGSREGACGAVGLVEHRDMWGNATLLDQEGEVLGRAIGTVGNEALRLEAEALGSGSSMVREAPTSAWRMARLASTSGMTAWSVSIR
jgi:hypothetical protein